MREQGGGDAVARNLRLDGQEAEQWLNGHSRRKYELVDIAIARQIVCGVDVRLTTLGTASRDTLAVMFSAPFDDLAIEIAGRDR